MSYQRTAVLRMLLFASCCFCVAVCILGARMEGVTGDMFNMPVTHSAARSAAR
jgi:hypothetical protein